MSTLGKIFWGILILFIMAVLMPGINDIFTDNTTGIEAMVVNATAPSPYFQFERVIMTNWHYILWTLGGILFIWVMVRRT